MAEAVIFVGLQGAGKTSYYRQHFAVTHTHISRDILRTPAREAAAISECLRSGRSYVIDNTNATRAARAPYIQQARAAGFRVLCCFFETPVRTAIGRNNHRADKKPVPVSAILRTAKLFEPPSLEEGIDDIRRITPEAPPAV